MLPLRRTPIWTLARRRRFLDTFRRDLESYFAAVSYEAFPFGLLGTAEVVHARESRAAWLRTSRAARTRAGVAVRLFARTGALVALAVGLLAVLGLAEDARSSSLDLIARILAVLG
ncbi:MAG: hypothetical protein Q8N53_22740 [Longimicrobiales bacterium]|nr:hypothetical protein [Longimicrobiales bacterium]